MSIFSWLAQRHDPVETGHESFEEPFLNEKGTVVESIKPGGDGVIKLQGVYWIAKSSQPLQWAIPTNAVVVVKERIGLTLIVEPAVQSTRTPLLSVLPRRSPVGHGSEHVSKCGSGYGFEYGSGYSSEYGSASGNLLMTNLN